jgi:uncharacterized protein YoaH (UPF0181 family)
VGRRALVRRMPKKGSKGFAAGAANPKYRDGSKARCGPGGPTGTQEQQRAGLALEQIGQLVAGGILTGAEAVARAAEELRAVDSDAAGGAVSVVAGGGGGAATKRHRGGGGEDVDAGEETGRFCGYPQCGVLLIDARGVAVDGEGP